MFAGKRLSLSAALACGIVSAPLTAVTSARADDFAYEGNQAGDFGVIDLTTGLFTSCGQSSVTPSGFGVGADRRLYAGRYQGTEFYRINLTNGKLTTIGRSNVAFWLTGSTTKGVYAIGTNGALYTIDIATGLGTAVGPTGIPITTSSWYGLSTNSAALYLTVDSQVYAVNLKSGVATSIGASGQSFGAVVSEGGHLYAGARSPLAIYSLDPKTGGATFISAISGPSGSPWGLAPIKAKSISTQKICAAHKL